MKNIKSYQNFVNENQKWKEILKPKPLDKIIQDLEKANLSPQEKFEFACENGIHQAVKELLKDESVDPSDDSNYAIQVSSEYGHLEVVKELLKDERVDPTDMGTYAIWLSSMFGHLEIVEEFLKDERVRDSLSDDELEVLKNRIKQLNENQKWKEILKPKPLDKVLKDLEESDYTPQRKFEFACQNGIVSVVKELLKDDRVDPSDYNNYSIRWASKNGHVEVVRELLKDDRVDPSYTDNYSIRWASKNGHLNVVKELLKDERVDPSDENNDAFIFTARNGHLDVVKELLKDDRVDPTTGFNQAIMWVSGIGNLEMVKELLKDERVRKSLSKKQLEKFENQIKGLNENNNSFDELEELRIKNPEYTFNLDPHHRFKNSYMCSLYRGDDYIFGIKGSCSYEQGIESFKGALKKKN